MKKYSGRQDWTVSTAHVTLVEAELQGRLYECARTLQAPGHTRDNRETGIRPISCQLGRTAQLWPELPWRTRRRSSAPCLRLRRRSSGRGGTCCAVAGGRSLESQHSHLGGLHTQRRVRHDFNPLLREEAAESGRQAKEKLKK